MNQCKFCTRTEGRVPGNTLWKGRLDSRICVDCALLILKQMVERQDKEFRKLKEILRIEQLRDGKGGRA